MRHDRLDTVGIFDGCTRFRYVIVAVAYFMRAFHPFRLRSVRTTRAIRRCALSAEMHLRWMEQYARYRPEASLTDGRTHCVPFLVTH